MTIIFSQKHGRKPQGFVRVVTLRTYGAEALGGGVTYYEDAMITWPNGDEYEFGSKSLKALGLLIAKLEDNTFERGGAEVKVSHQVDGFDSEVTTTVEYLGQKLTFNSLELLQQIYPEKVNLFWNNLEKVQK